MEKQALVSIIDKYYLNGIGEKVKWTVKNNEVTIKTFSPTIGAPEKDGVKQVCCGYYHTLFLSQNGVVSGVGRNVTRGVNKSVRRLTRGGRKSRRSRR